MNRYPDDEAQEAPQNVLSEPEDYAEKAPRPTLQDIKNLVVRQGGTLGTLPYSVGTMPVNDDFFGHIPSVLVANPSGLWGGYYYQAARDFRFMREEIAEEVTGAPESTRFFPQNWVVRIPSTCPDKVRQATDQLYSGDPQVTVRLTKPFRTQKSREEAEDLLTQVCYSFLQQSEANSESTLVRDLKLNVFSVGLAALQCTLNNRTYPEEPERRPGEKAKDWKQRYAEYETRRREVSPFVDQVINPLNICYDRAHTPMEWAVVREPIEVGQAATEYPHWKGATAYQNGQLPATTGQGSSVIYAVRAWYWDRNYCGCFINGEPAYDERDGADQDGIMENPYGFIPIWPAAGGHGQPDMMHRPQYELKGIVRDARDLLLVNAILYNLMLVWMHRASYGPKLWIKGPDDPNIVSRLRNSILGGPNVIDNVPTDYSFDKEEVPAMPDAILKLWELNLAEIDKAMFSDILSGQAGSVETAQRTRQRLQQVDKRLADSSLHCQQAIEGFLRGKLRMLKHTLQESTVWNLAPVGQPARWVTLKPDMIPYDNEIVLTVKLTGEDEDEEAREVQTLSERLGKSMDLETMLNRLKEVNPDEIIAGMEADYLRQNEILPMLQQIFQGMAPKIVAQVAQDAGIKFTPEELGQALPQPQNTMGVAPVAQPVVPAQPIQPQAGQEGLRIGPDGRPLLPAAPGLPAETVNPGVQMPQSPEADLQRGRLLRRPLPMPVGV